MFIIPQVARVLLPTISLLAVLSVHPTSSLNAQERPRARELGIVPGVMAPGALNAITDVPGVRVGQTTVVIGDSVNTGVTAILPHGGNLYRDRVPAAIHVGNGFAARAGGNGIRAIHQSCRRRNE
jgi:D-aminopeptidase